MTAIIQTIFNEGMHGIMVHVECQLTNGLPSFTIVGSAGHTIAESKERVRNALLHEKLTYPRQRITINLAPADIPKSGTGLDLPIAIAILAASKQIPLQAAQQYIFIGELGLSGEVRAVRGIIGDLLALRSLDYTFVIPYGNLKQAQQIDGLKLLPVRTLGETAEILNGNLKPKTSVTTIAPEQADTRQPDVRLEDISGQEQAKRALIIAAAGGHNVLLHGPPGTGKTLLAKAFLGLLPPPSVNERLEITHIHSLSEQSYNRVYYQRPLRSPHHNATLTSITGGGASLRPGELSLSHNGVLLLDEFPEFSRPVIESLRQPLEERSITVSRWRGSVKFPANFILIATANPCPCGFYGSTKECNCTPNALAHYRRKLSGPILDRIDLHIGVESINNKKLLDTPQSIDSSKTVSKIILEARQRQSRRNGTNVLNSLIPDRDLLKTVRLSKRGRALFDRAAATMSLSTRSYLRTLRTSLTIADLEGAAVIDEQHVAEALQYRQRY